MSGPDPNCDRCGGMGMFKLATHDQRRWIYHLCACDPSLLDERGEWKRCPWSWGGRLSLEDQVAQLEEDGKEEVAADLMYLAGRAYVPRRKTRRG